MLLRNFDSANQYFDLDTQKLISGAKEKYIGWYKNIDNTLSAIFVQDYKLCILCNNIQYTIDSDYLATVNRTENLNKKLFNLFHKEILIISFIYEVEESFNQSSPFEYLDDEDFDWGLYLFNIINGKDRKSNFINSLMSA